MEDLKFVKNTLHWNKNAVENKLRVLLEAIEEEYPVCKEECGKIKLKFKKVPKQKTFEIILKKNEALITYSSLREAARAVGSLLSGAVKEGKPYVEFNNFDTFGIMLDCSRNAVIKVSHLRNWLRCLALLGYNQAMLYTEDTYELPEEDFFGYMRGPYSQDELLELDEYASRLGIELIPCIQTLGHLEQILKWKTYEDVKDTPSVLLAGEKKTYELIEKMIEFWSDTFSTHRIHIGMDETHDLGRGQFLDKNGYKTNFDIFNEHLKKVTEICEKNQMKPMLWSDMYFRMGSKTGDYYDKKSDIPEEIIAKIPEKSQLVYWDYYHDDKEFYADWIERHRAMNHEPIMASGVWTWKKVWYDHTTTKKTAIPCIEACIEKNVKEIIFTMWGDDGAYCDFDSAFAGLAYVAEKAYSNGNILKEDLSARFKAVCEGDYEAHILAGKLNDYLAPGPLLWDDPLLGIYLSNMRIQGEIDLDLMAIKYTKLSKELKPYIEDCNTGSIRHAWLLARLMAYKTDFDEQIYMAYAANDYTEMKKVCKFVTKIIDLLEKVMDSYRNLWLHRYKPFGLEVIQIRFAGQIARFQELSKRLHEYMNGERMTIEELDGNLYSPGGKIKQLEDLPYHRVATGSNIL
ncbi:MAG: family 20 glycosylhydrolase [Verrucomicrobiota bacterium]|nr:family 20 glycosylhydrolase [Verrucomicrobiota bacterium]